MRARSGITILMLLGLLAAAMSEPSAAVRGLTTHGVGTGIYRPNDGSQTCPESPFVIEIVYLPNRQALIHLEFATQCVGVVGGVFVCCQVKVSTEEDPPVKINTYCNGTPVEGVHCFAVFQGTEYTVDVSGADSLIQSRSVSSRGAFMFDGNFTAV